MRDTRFLANAVGVTLVIFLLPLGLRAQSEGSLLARTVRSDLVIHAEVVGVSNVSQFCSPLKCQIVAFKVIDVLKGNYDSRFIRVGFFVGDVGRYVERNDQRFRLNRYQFGKGKQWILVLKSRDRFELQEYVYGSDIEPYRGFTCLQASMDGITPASGEEIEAFKALIKATTQAARK